MLKPRSASTVWHGAESLVSGLVEALSGWSGNKPGNDSGIVMSVLHMPPQENFEFLVFVNHILKQF